MTTLWRKQSEHYEVEIRVGNAWVNHARFDLESAARDSARAALAQTGVRAARVLAHELQHTCSVAFEECAETVPRIPPRMRDTGRRAECPVCGSAQPLANDGTTEWVFCAACQRATPHG